MSENPAEDFDLVAYVAEWLRPYQRRFIADESRYRVVVKSRQIGFTRVMALDMVLTSSGLHPHALCHNYTIVSKDEDAAKDVIADCLDWIAILRHDPKLRPFLALSVERVTKLRFRHSRRVIISQAQSPRAGVGKRGHLLLDEYAKYYQHQAAIWRYAVPSIRSNDRLRLTVMSTPDGAADHFHDLCTDRQRWSQFSFHSVDVTQAKADGMPVDIDECRRDCATEADFEQEYMCSFLVPGNQYISRALFESCRDNMPETYTRCVCGIDVASEQDLTAVVFMYVVGDITYIGEVYVIEGIPYQSNPVRGTLGQDAVLAAILNHHLPDTAVIDSTGDGGRIFGYLLSKNLPTRIVPHTYTRQWKLDWVPRVRGAMERGKLKIGGGIDLAYAPGVGVRFARNGGIDDVSDFVSSAFGRAHQDGLRQDFMKVHRRLTTKGPTFDTARGKGTDGHGDRWWAAAQAFCACAMPFDTAPKMPEVPTFSNYEAPESYEDFL